MKKILLAVTAALAITGCSQNEEFDAQGTNNEINVGTVVNKSARAADLTNTTFQSFRLSSFIVETDHDFATTPLGTSYMQEILYTGGQGSWATTGGTYYWPTGKSVQFFGWSPDANGEVKSQLTVPTVNGYPSLSFTIGASANSQKDIVVAAQKEVKPSGGNDISLAFKHILTKISFSVKPDDGYTYTVSALTLDNVKGGTATYTFNSGNGQWDLTSATSSSYTYGAMTIGNTPDAGSYYTLSSADEALMLLPQELTAGQAKIKISYSVEKKDVNYTYSVEDKTIDIPAITWAMGQSVRYKLTLPAGDGNIGINTSTLPDWATDTEKELK